MATAVTLMIERLSGVLPDWVRTKSLFSVPKKGANTKENILRNFGSAYPEGYR